MVLVAGFWTETFWDDRGQRFWKHTDLSSNVDYISYELSQDQLIGIVKQQ